MQGQRLYFVSFSQYAVSAAPTIDSFLSLECPTLLPEPCKKLYLRILDWFGLEGALGII